MKRYFLILFFLTLVSTMFAGKYHPAIQYLHPLPDSKLHSAQTTIILRLHEEYLDEVADPSNLIEVSGSSGENYSGQTYFATDDSTIIFKPDRHFDSGETISVNVFTSEFTNENFDFTFSIEANSSNSVYKTVEPDLKDLSTKMAIKMQTNQVPEIRMHKGMAVPQDFPSMSTIINGETAPGMIWYATNYPSASGNYLIICNNDGSLFFYRKITDVVRSGNFQLHANGLISYHLYDQRGRDFWRDMILDENLELVDVYYPGHGYNTDNHEFYFKENGHAVLIGHRNTEIDMSEIVEGGNSNANVQGMFLQELDLNKDVIFEFRGWDHYKIEDAIAVNLWGWNIDHIHLNSIDNDYDGHYITSNRNLNEITKINSVTGEIIWRLGGNNNQFDHINDNVMISWQHDARPVRGKPNHYLIFDNGRQRNPHFSRSVEYKIDTTNMTVENVWEYRYSPDRRIWGMGSSQRFSNGNTLIDWPQNATQLTEVTPDGDIVFELYSYGHSNYRARRYEWDGKMKRPELVAENYGYQVNLIFHQFGDDSVSFYKIYHRVAPDDFVCIDSTTLDYYEMVTPVNNSHNEFRITSVSLAGIESEASDISSAWTSFDEPGTELIRNGGFSTIQFWHLLESNSGEAESIITTDGCTIDIRNAGTSISDILLSQYDLLIIYGKQYELQFDAFSADTRTIRPKVQSSSDVDYSLIGYQEITPQSQHYRFVFSMEEPTDTDAEVIFECGLFDTDVTIDNVSLKEVVEADVNHDKTISPSTFQLLQNYPNPFNPSTTIRYRLNKNGKVSLKLYSLNGQELRTLINTCQNSGDYQVQLNANNLSSGIYLYRLALDNEVQIRKMMVLK